MIIPEPKIPTRLRTMIHDDLPLVSDIERRSYEFPWSHGVFRDCLLAGYICIVLERGEELAGQQTIAIPPPRRPHPAVHTLSGRSS